MTVDPDVLSALEEQRDFLRRSLDDLDRERAAGDIDEGDHAALRDDYERRLGAVETAVTEREVAFAGLRRATASGGRRRTVLVAGAVVAFAVISGFTVAQLAGRRSGGEGISGGAPPVATAPPATNAVGGPVGEQLAACQQQLGRTGPYGIDCFVDLMSRYPDDVAARTWAIGLPVLFGLVDAAALQEATVDLIGIATAAPDYGDVHGFLALAFNGLGRTDVAARELAMLDELGPTPAMEQLLASYRAVIGGDDVPSATTVR